LLLLFYETQHLLLKSRPQNPGNPKNPVESVVQTFVCHSRHQGE